MEQAKTAVPAYVAVDLGAASGRVMLGVLEPDGLVMREVHRFGNHPRTHGGRLVWDLPELFAASLEGIRRAARQAADGGARLRGIGIDTWGVDFALLEDGTVELPAAHHRDAPDPASVIADREMDEQEVFEHSGVADQRINTALRLGHRARTETFRGQHLLFVPDLWVYWLTGDIGTEATIASTSQLLDVRTGQFSPALVNTVGAGALTFPQVYPPGSRAGVTSPEITARLGSSTPIPVFRTASHDTASAFAFISPGRGDALVSSGTWSLVGLALSEPATDEPVRRAGFTNERGADGVLLLRNLSGMWLLQECLREWSAEDGAEVAIGDLLAESGELPYDSRVFDIGDERLLARGGMAARVRQLAADAGRQPLESRAHVVRAIIDSLATAYARTIDAAARLTHTRPDRVRIVGGGARNTVLCQLTADLTGLPVVAGPIEASSIGNIAVQAHADGAAPTIDTVYAQMRGDGTDVAEYLPSPALAGHPNQGDR